LPIQQGKLNVALMSLFHGSMASFWTQRSSSVIALKRYPGTDIASSAPLLRVGKVIPAEQIRVFRCEHMGQQSLCRLSASVFYMGKILNLSFG
jgi:hypothetical protein